MGVISLLFCTNQLNPLSWLIRGVTWSQWSHVALIDGDHVIESIALKGVVRTPLAQRIRQDSRFAVGALSCRDPSAVLAAAVSQIGKPYDYTAVLGIGLHRNWQERDSWFCSELIAWSFDEGGSPLFRAEAMHRVTPEDLWMLAPAKLPLAAGA